jgi:hypothetical protein
MSSIFSIYYMLQYLLYIIFFGEKWFTLNVFLSHFEVYIYIYINNNFLMYKFAIQIIHGPSKPKLPKKILDAFFWLQMVKF